VLAIKLLRGADCDIDHYLVVAKVRERLAVSKNYTRWRVKSSILLKSEIGSQLWDT
jgi:hypothetical protein